MALAGMSSGSAGKEQSARRSSRSPALGLQGRVRRAVVLRLMRVAVPGGGTRGRGGVGKRARPATGWGLLREGVSVLHAGKWRPKRRGKERGGVVGTWTEGVRRKCEGVE
jgi:hypothetical protein